MKKLRFIILIILASLYFFISEKVGESYRKCIESNIELCDEDLVVQRPHHGILTHDQTPEFVSKLSAEFEIFDFDTKKVEIIKIEMHSKINPVYFFHPFHITHKYGEMTESEKQTFISFENYITTKNADDDKIQNIADGAPSFFDFYLNGNDFRIRDSKIDETEFRNVMNVIDRRIDPLW